LEGMALEALVPEVAPLGRSATDCGRADDSGEQRSRALKSPFGRRTASGDASNDGA